MLNVEIIKNIYHEKKNLKHENAIKKMMINFFLRKKHERPSNFGLKG
jgi:hypothetical protein